MLTNKKKSLKHPYDKLRFSSTGGDIFANILRVSSLVGKKHYVLFKKVGLTEAQFFTLMSIYLSENKELTFTEISKLLMVSRANISGVIQRLEERNLIHRKADSNDRRLVYARLTREGEKLIEVIRPDYLSWISDFFSDLNTQELKVLKQLLLRLTL